MPPVARQASTLFVLTLALAALVFPTATRAATTGCTNEVPGRPTVALDAGHGGSSDTGTSNYGTRPDGTKVLLVEKDLTLDLANRTSQILITQYNYRVCLTRTGDIALTNTQRAQYANSVGANVLVLIHLNGSSDHTVDYTQTFWGKKNKDQQFSTVIYNALFPSLGIPGHGVGQFASGALLKSNMPATLAETVFLTNDNEANLLVDLSPTGNRRQQIAAALAQGIHSWLH
jgi:N-acetylmuramoyl-L-alanine amidase